ncbi:hypothetical protein UMM65_12895 [Aureibaculum sp. 2210JD6-5]|uniref:hypothetical protein n=1 Tax=Aureibaculum sp. 2210JD6-5 TaxID=3103957 RepID=UPI002AADBBF5|nr:hypothetical protein [Aureibaculum sp. 2210JD6-5]MDY7396141.1 hypothetical protein [Aureibaculum sp. 2210JD6-5]
MNLKRFIKSFFSLFFLIGFNFQLFSQLDSIPKTTPLLINDNQKKLKTLDISILDASEKESIFNVEKKPYLLGFKSNVDKYFNPPEVSKKKVSNFMTGSGNDEDDSDIMTKKYFNGKDVSDVQLSSDFSLGTLHSTSNTVRIEVRDHSLIDGDRIRVFLNEKMLKSTVSLKGLYYIINIDLKKGYNRIDIEALNEGFSGPNTAEIRVFDEKGYLLSEKEWNIRMGQIATLGVVKQ